MNPSDPARLSFDGLSVGDAFGERLFGEPADALARMARREPAPGPWRYTDDTERALSIVAVLETYGRIGQDALAKGFARRMEDNRGYWIAAHRSAGSEEALWETVSGLGDRDTTCAIVGGIVAMKTGRASIPENWLARREALPI
jgi:ADP-ribosylglycohydrolase